MGRKRAKIAITGAIRTPTMSDAPPFAPEDIASGRLLAFLEASGKMLETMIVFTSDHGDDLGDRWLGEKELFHEVSVRAPPTLYDPRPEADGTRGSAISARVEAIDLVPTFIDAAGAPTPTHRLEGRSPQPILHGSTPVDGRDAVFSEIPAAPRSAAR